MSRAFMPPPYVFQFVHIVLDTQSLRFAGGRKEKPEARTKKKRIRVYFISKRYSVL
jgi:hypothetical protein